MPNLAWRFKIEINGLISDQRVVGLSTMLMLYTNIALICVMKQMHVSSRSNRSV